MIYLKKFDSHASYETEINGGGVDISLPNVSYCEDVKDIHYTPYNLVRFYVGEITGTTPQTVKIYTDKTTFDEVQVSGGNKWYTYVLPKDKGLYKIRSGVHDSITDIWSNCIVKKVVVKANINFIGNASNVDSTIIPQTTVEASFKDSNTSKVTNMASMFYNCNGLTSLDVSNFDTSNVTNMKGMFCGCEGLTSLDLSGWDTSKVTNMEDMFNDCEQLKTLNLNGWNTSKVTDMRYMFFQCSGLLSLDVSGFDTSNVTDMYGMFGVCSSLESLDLSGWVISNGTNMEDMFNGCDVLKTIIMVGCSEDTVNKITAVMPSSATIVTE